MRISDWSSDVCSSDLDQRCVGKDTVQIHWRLGSDHRMVAVGYGVMQKAQRRIVVQPPDIGHEARQQVEHPVRLGDELRERAAPIATRSEEHTSELQSLMRISYAVFCLKKKNKPIS